MGTTTQAPPEHKPFDAKAYIAERNQGKPGIPAAPVEVVAPVEPVETKTPEAEEAEKKKHQNRRERREAERKANELAEERGRRMQLEDMLKKPEAEVAKPVSDEPQRKDFLNDQEYYRALAKHFGEKSAAETVDKAEQNRQLADHEGRMQAKMLEDAKLFPDWAEKAEEMADEDSPRIVNGSNLERLISLSEYKAQVLYYLASHPEEAQKLIDLGDGPLVIRNFGRLESKAEQLYSKPDSKEKTAAAAGEPEKATKEGIIPENAEQARATAASASETRKPKPSSEVAARGGAPASEPPKPGTAAWMDQRNREQFGSRR